MYLFPFLPFRKGMIRFFKKIYFPMLNLYLCTQIESRFVKAYLVKPSAPQQPMYSFPQAEAEGHNLGQEASGGGAIHVPVFFQNRPL
jgi:hypothetical protein